MRSVGLAEAKAQLSALLDAVARLVRELQPLAAKDAPSWPERLRRFHANHAPLPQSAVALVRELRDEE